MIVCLHLHAYVPCVPGALDAVARKRHRMLCSWSYWQLLSTTYYVGTGNWALDLCKGTKAFYYWTILELPSFRTLNYIYIYIWRMVRVLSDYSKKIIPFVIFLEVILECSNLMFRWNFLFNISGFYYIPSLILKISWSRPDILILG